MIILARWKTGKRPSKGRRPPAQPQKRIKKLNESRQAHFKYDLSRILSETDLEEGQKNSLTASLLVISTRRGIAEAKEYLKGKVEDGVIDESLYDKISSLLDRYSKWR